MTTHPTDFDPDTTGSPIADERDALWARLLAEGKIEDWMPGMTTLTDGYGGLPPKRPGMTWVVTDAREIADGLAEGYFVDPVPVWTAPGTLGCLLAMAREAWGRPGLSTKFDFPAWARRIDEARMP
jgi:hypothetical protein